MRVANLLQFTEHHRFTVYRNFSLGALDYKMLYGVYQPMIGPQAIAVYSVLYQQLAADRIGFSPLEQQRKLFLSLDLDPGENGRRAWIEMTSKLEAVSLLHTTRKIAEQPENDIYEYRLLQTLSPDEFFQNVHLMMLLRDKIGKHALFHLSRELIEMEPSELIGVKEESISVPFYELFQLNPQSIDHELEQAFYEMAPVRAVVPAVQSIEGSFQYADIIGRFPKGSLNRSSVESLQQRPQELARLNFVAKKYDLHLSEVCRLLDEDDVFDDKGFLNIDILQYRAGLMFRQMQKREDERVVHLARAEAVYQERTEAEEVRAEHLVDPNSYLEIPALFQHLYDQEQYNLMLRNEPYTHVLRRFFQNRRVPDGVQNAFEKIDLQYKLKEEVINVIIHYIHSERRSWAKASIDFVAADMLGKQVESYEQAVQYIREQLEYKKRAASGKKTKTTSAGMGNSTKPGTARQKPNIPIIQSATPEEPVTDEEFEAIRRKAQKLDRSRR